MAKSSTRCRPPGVDPELPFEIGPMNGRNAHEAGVPGYLWQRVISGPFAALPPRSQRQKSGTPASFGPGRVAATGRVRTGLLRSRDNCSSPPRQATEAAKALRLINSSRWWGKRAPNLAGQKSGPTTSLVILQMLHELGKIFALQGALRDRVPNRLGLLCGDLVIGGSQVKD